MDKMMTSSERTNQTLDKHVGDSTDSDNEEKEDGELEEGEVEEEFDENPQQKDDAKENNRENNSTNDSSIEQDNSIDINNHLNMASQKFRRRDYHQHHHLGQPRLNTAGGQQDKRNKHDLRRKRRHSGDERDDRNRKQYKRGRFRGGLLPDLPEDGDDDEMMSLVWPPRGQNRGQRKQQSDMIGNENSESTESGDQQSSLNPIIESKSEQSINSDETSSPINDQNDDENINTDEKQDRLNRQRISRPNQQQIENRGRRYYDGNTNNNNNNNNNPNNRRTNDRDRSSWQDRNNGNNSNTNSNNNQRFRSDTGSSTNHGPPLCKFFLDNRCMKGNDCLFSHDFKPPKKMEVCKYYVQNKGYCQKNDSCSYLHGEFPCKFFHTGTKDCMQGDRCKFSHDPIINEEIRYAFERYLNDSEEINRQNRGNLNNNIHHTNNSSAVNFDVIGAAPLPPPPPIPGSLTDPSNFAMIPNLMDLFLLKNSSLKASTNTETTATTTTANTSQSSPPVQRPGLFTDTLSTEKTDTEESTTNKTASSTNSTSPSSSSSTQNSTSTSDNPSINTVTTANTTPSMTTTTNSTCPLPLPPSSMTNATMNLPSPFGRLPPPNLTRPPSSMLPPPPPPGLFSLNSLGTGRVPILFPNNNGLPLPPPPGTLLDVKFLAQAAALAAVNAAVANKFTTTASHHHSQSSSPQLGRDIDERDRQSSTTMRGDIDERPSDVYNRPTTTTNPNLGLLQTSTNINSPSSSSAASPTMTLNDEHLKNKTIQDIFRTRTTSVETLSNSTSTAGPSFDFISMLEQLKQPRQSQANENSHDSLEIRSSSNQSSVYILRRVLVSFKPYPLPTKTADPRLEKYQEKMSQWSEQARFERFKPPLPPANNYSIPLRTPPLPSMINDTNSSRDPRLLRNSVSSSKIGLPILPTPNPYVRPNDNML